MMSMSSTISNRGENPLNAAEHKHTNRLINETSPYLLQHAHNPVDWYSWCDEAFKRAKKEDKPIFLSVGYSTCHWCHVMERESFENEHIASIMNKYFISIKVDREERPDVDAIYMKAVQAMSGQGGWPMSVFLTPDGKPFYGGTYFPPTDSFGRPGFEKILMAIADAWEKDRDKLTTSAVKITEYLDTSDDMEVGDKLPDETVVNSAAQYLKAMFDRAYGGFGRAPKFPQPSYMAMLLSYYDRTQDEDALKMVTATLDEMSNGGIYDHLGGGFHRYSTDARWLVPHFEKMLYDQALIGRILLGAYQVTGDERYAETAREVFDYVLRDMTSPEGGFYSAEDADSEGEEGIFYVWKPDEIEKELGADDAKIFNAYYNVTEKGNFEHKTSILNVTKGVEDIAKQLDVPLEKVKRSLESSRGKLFEVRSKRIRPHRDEKIIAAWNGMIISALAKAGAILEEPRYVKAAQRAAECVLEHLQADGRLLRSYAGGEAKQHAFLDDYAFAAGGFIDLYEATFEARWLGEARRLADEILAKFVDSESGGGCYYTAVDSGELIVRSKPDYDGAVPSGNSVAAMVLLRLGQITMDKRYIDASEGILKAYGASLEKSPLASTEILVAVDFAVGPRREIVIVEGEDGKVDEYLKVIRGRFMPKTVLIGRKRGSEGEEIERLVPFVKEQKAIGGKTTVFVCENYACKEPVTDLGKLSPQFVGK